MASDQDIADGLTALFRETNPSSFTSLNDVVLRLQSKLGFDLSHKIDFIRAQINILLTPQPQPEILPRPSLILPNPNPNPNPNHHPAIRHHLYHQHPQAHPHSHFPTGFGGGPAGHVGPTQISFAQPGGSVVDNDSVPVKESAQTRPKRRGGPGGLNKLCGVSPLLQTIVGQPAMPRTEIVKQLWAYIRKHNLQDPSNKRKIICNDELRLVFETDSTDMFQMNKLLAKHIVPLDATKDPGQQSKKLKVEDSQVPSAEPSPTSASSAPVSAPPASSVPAPATAPTTAHAPAPAPALTPAHAPAPIVISEALAKFFGISEKEMPQSEVFKRMEEYIKVEGLEDPLNSMVICDTKLQELLGCERISTRGIHEALARNHLFQRA